MQPKRHQNENVAQQLFCIFFRNVFLIWQNSFSAHSMLPNKERKTIIFICKKLRALSNMCLCNRTSLKQIFNFWNQWKFTQKKNKCSHRHTEPNSLDSIWNIFCSHFYLNAFVDLCYNFMLRMYICESETSDRVSAYAYKMIMCLTLENWNNLYLFS